MTTHTITYPLATDETTTSFDVYPSHAAAVRALEHYAPGATVTPVQPWMQAEEVREAVRDAQRMLDSLSSSVILGADGQTAHYAAPADTVAALVDARDALHRAVSLATRDTVTLHQDPARVALADAARRTDDTRER